MNPIHKQLADGRWRQLSFLEQMANIGSEIERALNWRAKNNSGYCEKAFERALDLIYLTIEDERNRLRLRELARLREALADFFCGDNEYMSTDASWRKYFACFTYAVRRNC